MATAKPKTNALKRKLGPLPVWAWAALSLAALFLFLYRKPSAGAATQLPFTPAASSGTQLPVSGQGSPADNGSSDLLDALGQNLSASDALLAALQASPFGGQTGGGSSAGTDTGSSSAPTVTGSATPGTAAPLASSGGTLTGDPEHNAYVLGQSDVDPFGVTTSTAPPDAVDRYLVNNGVDSTRTTQAVTQPTPIVVQPAPVDTTGVVKPKTFAAV